jgi:LacI family transcriptional regulator
LDGVICAFTRPPDHIIRELDSRNVPVLTIHREIPDEDYIDGDNQQGMSDLVARLYARFGKDLRPAFLGFEPAGVVSSKRLQGVVSACAAHGITIPESSIREVSGISAIDESLIDWLRAEKRNALLAYNDLVASAVQVTAANCGLRIPEEMALTGFDNSPFRELLPQPVDTITLPVEQLGIAAGEWISQRVIERTKDRIQRAIAGTYLPGKTV